MEKHIYLTIFTMAQARVRTVGRVELDVVILYSFVSRTRGYEPMMPAKASV